MPRSKLRQALGAVKDQTSLSLAKVSNNTTVLDVAILKATTHDESPIDDRHIKEIIQLVSSSQSHAAGCVQSIAKRIGKTRNWVVALKSLVLVLKIFQHGDPYFPCEVFHAMKQGAKILNLSGFRDNKSSSPWDYTAFVRAFALYLDERLDCVLTGKLLKEKRKSRRAHEPAVRDMKPAMLLDMILHWQKLIDKIIATTPTSVARNNKFLQICLYSIVQESFDLYKDISDALALLLDSFFQLQHQSCVTAFETCVRASKQFEQLGAFYMVCRSIGVGRSSEYPSVQKISTELIETLQEFLKDQSSFPINNGSRAPSPSRGDGALLLLPTPLSTRRTFSEEFSETTENSSEKDSDVGTVSSRHQSSSSITNFDFSEVGPQNLRVQELEIPRKSDKQRSFSEEFSETTENSSEKDSDVGTVSSRHPSSDSMPNFDFFEMGPHVHEVVVPRKSGFGSWELVLGEIENKPTTQVEATSKHHHFNPFLQDLTELTAADDECIEALTAPTFSARNADEKDMFGSTNEEWCMSEEKIVHEQQLWLEHQNKIIAKNMT